MPPTIAIFWCFEMEESQFPQIPHLLADRERASFDLHKFNVGNSGVPAAKEIELLGRRNRRCVYVDHASQRLIVACVPGWLS
jgi:hypothetical protein